MSENNTQKRIAYLDRLRIISCILVLLVHVSAQWTGTGSTGKPGFCFALSCNITAFIGVALFVMISGALALTPDKEMSVKDILFRRTLKFFFMYFLWKFIYFVLELYSSGKISDISAWKNDVILALFKKPGMYHLWFLPMIGLLFLLVPLIKTGCSQKENCRLYLVVWLILGILIPTAFLFEFPFKYLLMDLTKLFDISIFTGYLGYFILGHYLMQFADVKRRPARIYISVSALTALCLAFTAAAARSIKDREPALGFSSPLTLAVAICSIAVFLLFKGDNKDEAPSKLTKLLSDSTLAVYLIHPLILEMIKKTGITAKASNADFGIPLLLVLLTLCSFAVSVIYVLIKRAVLKGVKNAGS